MKYCSICFKKLENQGNNAEPINNGNCCDECNDLVVAARLQKLINVTNKKKYEDD